MFNLAQGRTTTKSTLTPLPRHTPSSHIHHQATSSPINPHFSSLPPPLSTNVTLFSSPHPPLDKGEEASRRRQCILQHSTALSTSRQSVKHPFHGVAATKPCTVTYSLPKTTPNKTAIARHSSNKSHSSSPLINPVTTPSVHRGTSLPSWGINYLIIYAS